MCTFKVDQAVTSAAVQELSHSLQSDTTQQEARISRFTNILRLSAVGMHGSSFTTPLMKRIHDGPDALL